MGLTQLAEGDKEAVLQAYTDRMKELAEAISGLDGVADKGKCYEELLATVQSLITDQGPAIPQFANKLRVLRENLLPKIVDKWDNLPVEVQKRMSKFGEFYCKMQWLINFTEELLVPEAGVDG